MDKPNAKSGWSKPKLDSFAVSGTRGGSRFSASETFASKLKCPKSLWRIWMFKKRREREREREI